MQNMTSGKPLGLIIKFAIPLLLSNLFQQLYSISDIILVGHLIGVKALAAVGAAACAALPCLWLGGHDAALRPPAAAAQA